MNLQFVISGSLRDFRPYNQESFDFFSTMKTCTGNEESFTNCTSGPELEDCSFSGVLYCTGTLKTFPMQSVDSV